jgi:ribosome-binding protein aMBF1 (putative translation factor)
MGDVDHDPTPLTDHCERCGRGTEGDLRLVAFRGRVRKAERTLCDDCAEELFEAFLETPLDMERSAQERSRSS